MTPILAQARRGERAFERLYRRHVADVYRYALVVLRDPGDAEDVTQTTFLNAYRAFGRGERPRNARAWLLALAHGVCRQRARATTDVDLDDDAARAVPDEGPPTPAEIRRALGRLPFNQRAALVMRELESRSYAEIAQVLDLSPGAVETLVFEARRALREQLEGALTCRDAERAISRQIDGRLPRSERRVLRAHLRECDECAGFARSQRAQRSAWKTLASVPLPASLQSFFGPGGVMSSTGNAGGVAVAAIAKTLAIAAIGASAVGLGYESVRHGSVSPAVPVVEEHAAPRSAAPATPPERPTATARPRSRADDSSSRAAPVAARPVAATPAPGSQPRTKPVPAGRSGATRAQALPVRARSRPKPPGHNQAAASLPSNPPAHPVPTEQPARSADPAPATPPLVLPQFPPAPPLPLPEPPKLP